MQDLFPIVVSEREVPLIPGLLYCPGYLTGVEEQALAELIDLEPWDTKWQRRRQPYGVSYGKGLVARPIPDWGQMLADRLLADEKTDTPFDQMLVNEYLPGQGIAMHRDYEPFGRTVVSLRAYPENPNYCLFAH